MYIVSEFIGHYGWVKSFKTFKTQVKHIWLGLCFVVTRTNNIVEGTKFYSYPYESFHIWRYPKMVG